MRTILRDIVGILIVSKDEKVFLVKGNPKVGGVYSDCWRVPGGGVEEGETKEQAVVREAEEETGLDLSKYKLIQLRDSGHGQSEKTLKQTGERVICEMKFTDFMVKIDDCDARDIAIILSDEHSEFGWFIKSELRNLKLGPPTKELFEEIGFI